MKLVLSISLLLLAFGCLIEGQQRPVFRRRTTFDLPILTRRRSGLDDDVLPADDRGPRSRGVSNSLVSGDDDGRKFNDGDGRGVRVHSPQYQPFLLSGLSPSQVRFANENPRAFSPFLSRNIFRNQGVSRTPVNNFLPSSAPVPAQRNSVSRDRQRTVSFSRRQPAPRPALFYLGTPRNIDAIQSSFDYDRSNGFGIDFDLFKTDDLDFSSGEQSNVNRNSRRRTTRPATSRPRTALLYRPRLETKRAPVPAPRRAPVPAPRRAPVPAPRRAPVPAPRRAPVPAPRRIPVPALRRAPVPAPRRVPVPTPRRAQIPAPTPRRVPASNSGFRSTSGRRSRVSQPSPVNHIRVTDRNTIRLSSQPAPSPRHQVNHFGAAQFRGTDRGKNFETSSSLENENNAQVVQTEIQENPKPIIRRPSLNLFGDSFFFGDILKTSALKKKKTETQETSNGGTEKQDVRTRSRSSRTQFQRSRSPVSRPPSSNRVQTTRSQISRPHVPRPDNLQPQTVRSQVQRPRLVRTQIRPTRKPEITILPATVPTPLIARAIPTSRERSSRNRSFRRNRLTDEYARPRSPRIESVSGGTRRDSANLQPVPIQDFAPRTPNDRSSVPATSGRRQQILEDQRRRSEAASRSQQAQDFSEKDARADRSQQRSRSREQKVPTKLRSNTSRSKLFPDDTDGDGSPGTAGVEYPVYSKIPKTSFSCVEQKSLGYYADPEAHCQVFHFCQARGIKTSFLCPNGTLYNQQKLACEWWHNVNCEMSQNHYHVNDRLYKDPSEEEEFY